MIKPHGRDCPDRCSMCLQRAGDERAIPKKATYGLAGELLIDGVPATRGIAPSYQKPAHSYAKRKRAAGG